MLSVFRPTARSIHPVTIAVLVSRGSRTEKGEEFLMAALGIAGAGQLTQEDREKHTQTERKEPQRGCRCAHRTEPAQLPR